jgi:amino acid adenylation domain-containing protein
MHDGIEQFLRHDVRERGRLRARRRETIVELTPVQKEIWLTTQLDPDRYNILHAWELDGQLDVDRLARATADVMERHDIFRTAIVGQEGEPVGYLLECSDGPAPATIDLSGATQADFAGFLRAFGLAPYELNNGVLWRAAVVRLAADRHVLALGVHHIAFDGWSEALFAEELKAGYTAPSRIRHTQREVPQQRNYAEWLRRSIHEKREQELKEFWARTLACCERQARLPFAANGAGGERPNGGAVVATLSPERWKDVASLAAARGVSPFVVWLSLINALIHRYTSQSDLIAAVPTAGRLHSSAETMIGCFVNVLPVRVACSRDLSFAELVSRVGDAWASACDHQELSSTEIARTACGARDSSDMTISRYALLFDSNPDVELSLPGIASRRVQTDVNVTVYDLNFFVRPAQQGARITLLYNAQIYERAYMERMLGHLDVLAAGCLRQPNTAIAQHDLLTAWEQEALRAWNSSEENFDDPPCVHQLFERQADQNPEAWAALWDGGRMSYAELDEYANGVAEHLVAVGVGPETPVGVLLDRSIEMLIALLGVIKAGGAYVPLDPSYPRDRLDYMLSNSGAALVITDAARESFVSSHRRVMLISAIAAKRADRVASTVSGANLLYVMYTSGSTGRPKGVMISHDGIRNRLLALQRECPLERTDRLLQKTTFSFDVSVWEIFWPLSCGATVVLAAPGGQQDPVYLREVIARQGVTLLHFIPPMLEVFLDQNDVERCTSLRRVICGSEVLPVTLQRRLWSRLDVALRNHYGPTEASVEVTTWDCERESNYPMAPIGFPVRNVKIHILDGSFRQVPIGIPGELYCSGTNLARGYSDAPDRTAERFVPDPFNDQGGRMYRTGDLACYLPTGEIMFLGRTDHQVRIRGTRVELGEIQAVLVTHPSVAEAAVFAVADESGGARVLAAVVARDAAAMPAALREHLAQTLPSHMLPAAFLLLDRMPVTATGKVDRAALLAKAAEHAGKAAEYVAPATVWERRVAQVWQELLGVQQVGATASFFELGGHSLLALRSLFRIESEFGLTLSAASFFASPSLREVAKSLEVLSSDGDASRRAN